MANRHDKFEKAELIQLLSGGVVENNLAKRPASCTCIEGRFSVKIMLLKSFMLVCVGLGLSLDSMAVEDVGCIDKPLGTGAVSEQSDRLRMCALIGIWAVATSNNQHGYSDEVVAWVDDSVAAMRAAIHNLDLLQCTSFDSSALAQATLLLVTQISENDFGKNKLKPFEMASSTEQSPCVTRDKVGSGKLVTFAAEATPGYFQPSICAFEDLKLPKEFVVFAAGAYAGRKTGFQIDQSGHEATQIDVAVNHAKPVVLMLGAYEPTIWNIGWTPDTQIVAVLASGYHRQIVAGLKGDIPVIISSYDNQGACGYFYASETATLSTLSHRLFKHPVDMIYPAQAGRVLVGKPIPAGIRLLTSTSAPPASFQDTSAPLAGPAGLDDAVQKGLLRRATSGDVEAWADAERECSSEQDVSPVNEMRIPKRPRLPQTQAYVVLKPLIYPAGLYGAHSATFYIPKGIPRPSGNLGHSAIYDFNTMHCQGGHVAVKHGLDVSPVTRR